MITLLTENIEKLMNIDTELFKFKLNNQMENSFQFFHNKPLNGEIIGDKLIAKINPPIGMVDGLKSIVSGEIKKENNFTRLTLKIEPNLIVLLFVFVWEGLVLLCLIKFSFLNISQTVRFVIIMLTWALIPIILTRLKLKWDKSRLNKLIEGIILNVT